MCVVGVCLCVCSKYVKDDQKQNSYLFGTRPKIHRYRKENTGVIMVNSRRKTQAERRLKINKYVLCK